MLSQYLQHLVVKVRTWQLSWGMNVYLVRNQLEHSRSALISNSCEGEWKEVIDCSVDCNEDSSFIAMGNRSCQTSCPGTKAQDCPEQASLGSILAKEGDMWDLNRGGPRVKYSGHRSSSSLIADGMENGADRDDGVVEHNHLTSSSMTGSSNDSSSVMNGSWSDSQSIENQKHSKGKSMGLDSVSKIIVKATYREDTIRFKFDLSVGCH